MARARAVSDCGWTALLELSGTRNGTRNNIAAPGAAHWHASDGCNLRGRDGAGVDRSTLAPEGTRLATVPLDGFRSDQVDPGRFRPGAVCDLVCFALCLWRGPHRS